MKILSGQYLTLAYIYKSLNIAESLTKTEITKTDYSANK